MSILSAALLVTLGTLLTPATASAQHAEEGHTEIIRPKSRLSRGKSTADPKEVAALIVRTTNAFRKEQGRAAVQVNAKLTETARDFAQYMAKTSRYGHHADGHSPSQRARAHGYDFCIIAENIAYQYSSAGFGTEELGKGFFEGWKHSPPHRKNMLDPDVIETGVAVAQSAETGYWFAVQMFGRPKAKAISFKIENATDATIQYKLVGRTFALPAHYIRTHEVGRPPEVTFDWPKGGGAPTTVQADDGAAYVITQDGDRFHVKKQ